MEQLNCKQDCANTYSIAMLDLCNEGYDMNLSVQRICDQRQALFLKPRNKQNKRWDKTFRTPDHSRRVASCWRWKTRTGSPNQSAARCQQFSTKSWRCSAIRRGTRPKGDQCEKDC